MADNNSLPIPPGDTAFYDNYIPSIEAGIYTISVKSGIDKLSTKTYFNDPITRTFEVRAPQFSLSSQEIHSVFPPDNSNSRYDNNLACIVFEKKVIPWERYLDESDPSIPWLALIVFKDEEIGIDKNTNSSLLTTTVQQFLSPHPDILKPGIKPSEVNAEVLTSNCRSILISADAFKALTPRLPEMKYLSLVQQVNIASQAVGSEDDRGWYSIVFGNRLVKGEGAGTRYYAHLVSLEGFASWLKDDAVFPKKASDPSKEKDVQLISLYNWTFLSQAEKGGSFADLVENFVAQSQGTPENLLLRRNQAAPENPTEADKEVQARLQNGYTALQYQTETGESTFAWYRGPLTPVTAQELPKHEAEYHYPSASSAMMYDKANGVFDQSYAAAWSIGRALALSDAGFSQAMLTYRRTTYRALCNIMDNGGSEKPNNAASTNPAAGGRVVTDVFHNSISQGLGENLSSLFADMTGSSVIDAPHKSLLQRLGKILSSLPAKIIKIRSIPKASVRKKPSPVVQHNAVQNMKNALADDDVRNMLQASTGGNSDPVTNWLTGKALLYGVPFNHLVPDQTMLPAESMRFFYVDKSWINLLIDGAISIGVQSSKDASINALLKPALVQAVNSKVHDVRNKLLGFPMNESSTNATDLPFSGILIRSAVVSGWPGLEIKGFKAGTEVAVLRMDILPPAVLICLFSDIPDTITISEPQQGLRFGVEDNGIITLRNLADPVGKPIEGKIFPLPGGFDRFFRPAVNKIGGNVLNINNGENSVVKTLQQKPYLNKIIGPAEFGIQMVKAPEKISFNPQSE